MQQMHEQNGVQYIEEELQLGVVVPQSIGKRYRCSAIPNAPLSFVKMR